MKNTLKQERKTRTLVVCGGFHNTRKEFRINRQWWSPETGWQVPEAEKELLEKKISKALCCIHDCRCYGGYGEVGYLLNGKEIGDPCLNGDSRQI